VLLPPEDPWASYVRIVVQIARPGVPDLVVRSAPTARRDEWPWTSLDAVHILTAWDPGNALLGEHENAERQAALEADIHALDPTAWWPTVGVDPLSGHREEGLAVQGLAESVVVQIGARYDQDAIFSWTTTEWAVVACIGARRVRLGWSIVDSGVPTPTARIRGPGH
jgi:Protein of unknown function (DUF3293)